jgi:CRISPR system Cascade subunit CasB
MSSKHPLVAMLERIYADDDRAKLAALRQGLTPATEASVYPFVAPFFPSPPRPWIERAYILVAALFALHPGDAGLTIGAALRRVLDYTESESVELRFAALLNAHVDDLGDHLRHAVSLARSKDVPIDWNDVLYGVLGWEHEDRRVQRSWARDFWGSNPDKELI